MAPTDTVARVLTAAEFQAAVLALAPRLAVFDCDGTLWSGDAGSGFMRWTIDRGILSPEAVAWLDRRYQGYLAGQVSEFAICGEMVQVYCGLSESDMRAAAAEFFATEIEHRIFPQLRALIAQLQSAGTEIWAVSRVLAAQVDVSNGIVTDTLIGVPTDEGKVTALARAGITTPDCVFGNSVHDAAMLAIARAGGAFPVNPSPALLTRAAAEGWHVFYPATVRPI
jgi:phosphoserine phosphatase